MLNRANQVRMAVNAFPALHHTPNPYSRSLRPLPNLNQISRPPTRTPTSIPASRTSTDPYSLPLCVPMPSLLSPHQQPRARGRRVSLAGLSTLLPKQTSLESRSARNRRRGRCQMLNQLEFGLSPPQILRKDTCPISDTLYHPREASAGP